MWFSLRYPPGLLVPAALADLPVPLKAKLVPFTYGRHDACVFEHDGGHISVVMAALNSGNVKTIALLSLFAFSGMPVRAAVPPIVGEWIYTKILYQGHELPPRDPRLMLSFLFSSTGEDRLYWTRDNNQTFCERKGRYSWDGHVLHDKVTWVNPQNRSDCSEDPDMQLERQTETPLVFINEELQLHLPLGDEEVIYVLKRKTL